MNKINFEPPSIKELSKALEAGGRRIADDAIALAKKAHRYKTALSPH